MKPHQAHGQVSYLRTCDINSYVCGELDTESLQQQLQYFDDMVHRAAAFGQGAMIACMQGANRSAITSVLYLCCKTGAGVRTADDHLHWLRPITDIGIGLRPERNHRGGFPARAAFRLWRVPRGRPSWH